MFELRDYQERCLRELATYLRRTVELGDADVAFYEQTRRTYRQVKALPGLPYVCVRVPTGGGKTVMAAHAVELAAKHLLQSERCIALWVAPTTQIVRQTLDALSDREHPYRQALDTAFAGCVSVMDLSGALSLSRSMVESDTIVVVSTMAAFRVENTEGRKIYEQNGRLMEHFTGLTDEQREALREDGSDEQVTPSLANLFRLRRPVLIVDEAHNARTALSFDALARFGPSCILEFTATPDEDPKGDPSNVLTHVSAAELKAEEMIKLPIRLRSREQWKEAVAEALEKQAELERLAKEEEKAGGEYIRPIVLFQAQRNLKGEACVTYDVLKQSLLDDFKIDDEQIAIATGKVNELDDVPILKRGQPVRFIITVDKLREGWDCPFAYILCSVANLSSRTAVEQILGRILRMPYAKRRAHEDLNVAYAYVTSSKFVESANALTEALVQGGFERYEARSFVKPLETGRLDFGPLFDQTQTVTEILSNKPSLDALPGGLREKVSVCERDDVVEITYTGPALTDEDQAAIEGAVSRDEDKLAVKRLVRKSRGEDAWAAAMGEAFEVPQLAVRIGGQVELFEDQFREVPWRLSDCDAALSDSEFSVGGGSVRAAVVDVDQAGKIKYRFVDDLARQLSFLDVRGPKTQTKLAVWLDFAIAHLDITHAEAGMFFRRAIDSLMQERGFSLEQLVRSRFRLRDALQDRLRSLRNSAHKETFQRMLLPDAAAPLEVSPALCFTFPLTQYPANRLYTGPVEFRNHYYQRPGDMNAEEADCAVMLDSMPDVKFWVRNLERGPFSFWLPTSTDRFYPDFVAALADGRHLVVEYKGADRWSDDDSREKRTVGDLWAERSGGKCIFVMPKGRDFNAITAAIG